MWLLKVSYDCDHWNSWLLKTPRFLKLRNENVLCTLAWLHPSKHRCARALYVPKLCYFAAIFFIFQLFLPSDCLSWTTHLEMLIYVHTQDEVKLIIMYNFVFSIRLDCLVYWSVKMRQSWTSPWNLLQSPLSVPSGRLWMSLDSTVLSSSHRTMEPLSGL